MTGKALGTAMGTASSEWAVGPSFQVSGGKGGAASQRGCVRERGTRETVVTLSARASSQTTVCRTRPSRPLHSGFWVKVPSPLFGRQQGNS